LQANYLALSGISVAQYVGVLASSAQAMSTFTNMHSLIYNLLAGNSTPPATMSVQVSNNVVQAVYDRMLVAGSTNASKVRMAIQECTLCEMSC
jgi:hypothetical protein